ncbi:MULTISPECIES: M20 family metallopeptidase [Paraburkholderia]|jgi:succinyl-diaminopimelate desuccinylase|uniref:Peptidase dimerization protein n=1 Tax=Paraburkholderia hospita TaxID=169430 RepID=A0AAN1MIN3_9BURK|nr:M20/M25/M40 family metallo-hydrolase [Paraburkholderia hospita]AUT68425.1 peptidase dimerization protein [Paraburkholderia hospita]SEH81370.1 succinyl-diaminopimelate desuccinylase [Paraburkholderia hospita]
MTGAVDTASIVDLLTALVRVPSRGGIDARAPVLECIKAWFDARDVRTRRLVSADGQPLALHVEIRGAAPGPHYLLNATLDTASFGDESTWTYPPLAAHVENGWLYGRGSADSKAAVAIFAHLAAELAQRRDALSGTLDVLFDLDEHTGRFGGARAFFDAPDAPRPNGVLIGYPGIDRIIVGARGFIRAKLVVRGVAAHSGASSTRGLNAAIRGAHLAAALNEATLPVDHAFDRPAQLTVTGIRAGDGTFTSVPDRCELTVDCRLTPGFDAAEAQRVIEGIVRTQDAGYDASLATSIEWIAGWPAYRVPDSHPMTQSLYHAARNELGAGVTLAVAGPSNIGNYLASLGVPALCGFGVQCEGIHAANERIELVSIAPVYRVYESALLTLLAPDKPRA